MRFLPDLFGRGWDLDSVAAPWGERPSLYGHLVAHVRPGTPGLAEGGEQLPDEEEVSGGDRIRWAPGALDGTLGGNAEPDEAEESARKVVDAMAALLERATSERAAALYEALLEGRALDYVDALIEAVGERSAELDAERLHAVARWLALGAADREPVKVAIALLGILRGGHDRELLMTLGRHDELTLFAAVALQSTDPTPEQALLELARHAQGWGRVHVVTRLAEARDDQVRAWLLREGYKNGVMYEYTALACATGGGLADALRLPAPDDALLSGAGIILQTLVQGRGGPGDTIGAYADGPEVAELYLRHLDGRPPALEHAPPAAAIRDFVEEDEGEARDPLLGWPQRRAAIVDVAARVLALPRWEALVNAALASTDTEEFHLGAAAARAVGMDPWEAYFARIQRGDAEAHDWFPLMQTEDPERLARAVALAEARIPLRRVATGPDLEMGFGPEFEPHNALDFVLQDLHRLPGAGWPLIRAGLRSPTLRNRHMAVRAFKSWEREAWPEEAESLLVVSLAEEPDEGIRESITRLFTGEPDPDDDDDHLEDFDDFDEDDDDLGFDLGSDDDEREPWRG